MSRFCCTLFFFSSRRRHTRWNCDWSSDVCSSDLDARFEKARAALGRSSDIAHKDIDLPDGGERSVDNALRRRIRFDIAERDMRRAAGFRDRLDYRLRPRLVPAVDHDRDALPGQRRRDAGTDARRAAGDERSLALKLQVHLNLLREGPSGQLMSTVVDFGLRKVC